MTKPRKQETDEGIPDSIIVHNYDQMMRSSRDKGYLYTNEIIESGIEDGWVLEVGPGPGYLGLDWLKNTERTWLTGLDISADMVKVAEKNALEYGLEDRVEYVVGNAMNLPFDDEVFDAVFSNASLHEWEDPAGGVQRNPPGLKRRWAGSYVVTCSFWLNSSLNYSPNLKKWAVD